MKQQSPQMFIDALNADHRAICARLQALRAELKRGTPDVSTMQLILMELEVLDLPHHDRESEIFFARIRHRCPAIAPVLDRLEAEHRSMGSLFLEAAGDLERCADDPTFALTSMTSRLERFVQIALGHIEVEETYILPVAVDFLTDEDWAAIGGTDLL